VVTAIAVSLGRHLGFNNADKQRLALAGLLHDIGKARIPIEILEKPGPLSEAEMAVMRTHPELGVEACRACQGSIRNCSTWWCTTMSISTAPDIRTACKETRFRIWSA